MAQNIPPQGRNKIKAWVKRFENARKAFRMPPDTPGSSTTEVNRQSYYESEINEKHAADPGVSGLIRDEASVPADTIVPQPLDKHATEPVEAMQPQSAALRPVVAVQAAHRQRNSPPTVTAAQPHSNSSPPVTEAVNSQALDRLQPQRVQEIPPGTFGAPAPRAPAIPGNVLVNGTDAPAEAPALLSPPRAIFDQEKLVSTESLVPAITLQGRSLTGIHYPELGDKFDTRLVCIEPATSDPHKIECRTRAIALHDDEVYDALSHFWGPPTPQRTIILNGQPFVIREALFEALQALRDRDGTGWLWIDNISIDQENDLDKERQIAKMNVIYAYATRVFAWLGPRYTPEIKSDKEDGEAGVRFLAGDLSTDRAPNELQVRAVLAVIDRPYWTRCWIIQEICSSKQVTIMCGSAEADFTPFWEKLERYFTKYGDPYIKAKMRQHFDSLNDFRDQEILKSREPQMSLINALLLSRRSSTTIGRDKIFAILRLAHDSNKLMSTPNYTQDESIIFWRLAHNMIHLQGHVAVILLARRSLKSGPSLAPKSTSRGTPTGTHKRLSYISNTDIKAVKKGASAKPLPSWVPLWSSLADPLPKWIEDSVRKKHHSAEPPKTSHYEDVLCVRGVVLEYITSISGMPTYPKFASPLPEKPRTFPSTTDDAPRSRQSTMNRLRSRTIIVDFWRTVLGPVYAIRGMPLPHVGHQCGEFGCLGKTEEPEGVAIASVLGDWGNQDGEQSKIIRQWMNVNENLLVGHQTLRAWVEEIIKSAYNLPHSSKAASGKPRLCNLSFEIHQLSQAFRAMEDYSMRLAVTDKETFKLVYCEAMPGDAICRIDHCLLPVVLRPLETGSWLSQGSISLEPGSMLQEEQRQDIDPTLDSIFLESHHEPTASLPSHALYTFIGETFRFEYETASWADERYTGWKAEDFDEEHWVDLRIA